MKGRIKRENQARNEVEGFLRINTECACGILWGVSSTFKKRTLKSQSASFNRKGKLKNECPRV